MIINITKNILNILMQFNDIFRSHYMLQSYQPKCEIFLSDCIKNVWIRLKGSLAISIILVYIIKPNKEVHPI